MKVPPLRAVLLLAVLIAACGSSDASPRDAATPPADTIELRYEGGTLRVELAITGEERARGLSNRTSLPQDAGMLFVYDEAHFPAFWMRQTLIPLDMVWIGADKRVGSVTANVQPEPGVPDAELRLYRPDGPAQYVLELNAGAATRLGIDPGDQLSFDPVAR